MSDSNDPKRGRRVRTPTVRRVVAGDTLASLAWAEYGDPTVRRVIAEANGIDDPMRVRVGNELGRRKEGV